MSERRRLSRGQLRRLTARFLQAGRLRERGDLPGALVGYRSIMLALSDELALAVRRWLGPDATIESVSLGSLVDVIARAVDGRPPTREAFEVKALRTLMAGVYHDAAMTVRQIAMVTGTARDRAVREGVIQAAACAILSDPWSSPSPHNLGRYLNYLGDMETGIVFLTASVTLDPTQTEAWRYLGEVYGERGDRAAAERCWDNATRCPIRDSVDAYNLSLVYLNRGDYATGWPMYERRWECAEIRFSYARPDLPWPRWAGPAMVAA